MKDYIITWNCGYGDNYEVVAAKNKEQAMDAAYEAWKDDAESNADYDVIGEVDHIHVEYDPNIQELI